MLNRLLKTTQANTPSLIFIFLCHLRFNIKILCKIFFLKSGLCKKTNIKPKYKTKIYHSISSQFMTYDYNLWTVGRYVMTIWHIAFEGCILSKHITWIDSSIVILRTYWVIYIIRHKVKENMKCVRMYAIPAKS